MLPILLRKLRSFGHQPFFVQRWFIPLWLLLGISKAVIFTVSFRRLAPCLGDNAGLSPWVPLTDPKQAARARQIGHAIRMAARYTPWDSNCFPQAVAARLLLGWYGIPYALYFGLHRDPDSAHMTAHAWVTAGRWGVTGGSSFGRYTVVGFFVAPGLNNTRE